MRVGTPPKAWKYMKMRVGNTSEGWKMPPTCVFTFSKP